MQKEKLKNAVRYFYDLQKLRIQSNARATKKAEQAQAYLDEADKAFLDKTSESLKVIERDALKEVRRLLKGIPIFEQFLKDVKGIGPTMAGVLVAEFEIDKCNTVSQMWAWGGLAVRNGKADKLTAGQKARYNPWLKAKLVRVLAECLIKCASLDESGYHTKKQATGPDGKKLWADGVDDDGNLTGKKVKVMDRIPWPDDVVCYRSFYDNYKHRKENQVVDECMGCEGTGKVKRVEREAKTDQGEKKPRKMSKCPNCKGTGGPAAWGASQAHRHNAAMRYMVKMLLQEFWVKWRTLESLDVRAPYAEEYLGRAHHTSQQKQDTQGIEAGPLH